MADGEGRGEGDNIDQGFDEAIGRFRRLKDPISIEECTIGTVNVHTTQLRSSSTIVHCGPLNGATDNGSIRIMIQVLEGRKVPFCNAVL